LGGISLNELISSNELIKVLRDKADMDSLEMEAYPIAKECIRHNKNFVALLMVSDKPLDQQHPEFIFWRHPGYFIKNESVVKVLIEKLSILLKESVDYFL